MKMKYRRVDTSTLDGLKKAERLHRNGWKMESVGLFIVEFSKIKRDTK